MGSSVNERTFLVIAKNANDCKIRSLCVERNTTTNKIQLMLFESRNERGGEIAW
jgi:hypothetical protein